MDKFLNLGCGNKYHEQWVNIDLSSNSKHVLSANLLKGIPFEDNSFDVVYHSQVLEHFPPETGTFLVNECFRVLKPGGFIRIVVPDLENIVDEYKKQLTLNLENPDIESASNYDWIMLELFDQAVRHYPGGRMAEYLSQKEITNEEYILNRIGHTGRILRAQTITPKNTVNNTKSLLLSHARKIKRYLKKRLMSFYKSNFISKEYEIGKFRQGGEVHFWMYDRYSLARILQNAGFSNISQKTPFISDIPYWERFELDVKDGLAYDPVSLFIEAKK